ncbi:MAG: hypothetical protein ABI612_09395, partial [Betaproteobacteria bacterium]
DTYGDKDRLFLAALTRYQELQHGPIYKALARQAPAAEVLRGFFDQMVENLTSGTCKGCFMANTVTGLASQDDSVFEIGATNHRQLEAAFSGLLLRAQQSGEIPADRPLLPIARFLVNTMNGLGVTAKATRDKKVLKDIADVALSALGF